MEKVHLSVRLNTYGLFGVFTQRKYVFSERSMAACHPPAKLHLNKARDIWSNALGTDEMVAEAPGHNAQQQIWGKKMKHCKSLTLNNYFKLLK